MKKQLLHAAASTVLGLSLTTGFAAADISGTGPSSHNSVSSNHTSKVTVTNKNNIGADSDNWQSASTGSASVQHNTTGGDATSGDASNGNSTSVTATVDNTGMGGGSGAVVSNSVDPGSMGSISDTGPDSDNTIKADTSSVVTVKNTNNISVSNDNDQSAKTGNASVSDNTTGGNATSGDASNSSSNVVDLDVSN